MAKKREFFKEPNFEWETGNVRQYLEEHNDS